MVEWFGGNWDTVGSVALVTLAVYLSAVFAIRFLDRRALAEMSGFDFVVAVAMGTIIGRTATTREPTYVQGVVALVVLLLAHRALSMWRARSERVLWLVDRRPVVVARDGDLDRAGMAQAHLTEADVREQLRLHGVNDLGQVHRMMLEPSGKMSIVRVAGRRGASEDAAGAPPEDPGGSGRRGL